MFVDDMKVYTCNCNADNLIMLTVWTDNWKMIVNTTKTFSLTNYSILQAPERHVKAANRENIFVLVQGMKYLGVHLLIGVATSRRLPK